jgi:hypothetical protein
MSTVNVLFGLIFLALVTFVAITCVSSLMMAEATVPPTHDYECVDSVMACRHAHTRLNEAQESGESAEEALEECNRAAEQLKAMGTKLKNRRVPRL